MKQSFSGKAASFNGAAETYDKMRPGYVPALYQEIFTYLPLSAESRVLEVGTGTGQATRPILETGCTLIAVEPGDKLAQTAGENSVHTPIFRWKIPPLKPSLCQRAPLTSFLPPPPSTGSLRR